MSSRSFGDRVLGWGIDKGRRGLPWQIQRTPYRVWVSEIMLQQTQVQTVIGYFQPFVARLPDVAALAAADFDEVMQLWSGLGYYARARNLHRAAKIVMAEHGGELPLHRESLQRLPGIGRSTAGAILALATGQRQAILDGNVKRVLCRFHAIEGWPGQRQVADSLWQLAEQHTPEQGIAEYTQAIMDLGSMVCTRPRPRCEACPLRADCRALAQGRVGDYPWPRPRRLLPARQTVFLMVRRSDGRVLLERRPPTGVWGGLWGFPECSPETDLEGWCLHRFGQSPRACSRLPVKRHSFSHYHLEILPILLEVDALPPSVMESDSVVWYQAGESQIGGLPAPVAVLLQGLLSDSQS
ncbi:MAG: A/G-specific adenine glycosylase [Gammaproteobacteria bacterium]